MKRAFFEAGRLLGRAWKRVRAVAKQRPSPALEAMTISTAMMVSVIVSIVGSAVFMMQSLLHIEAQLNSAEDQAFGRHVNAMMHEQQQDWRLDELERRLEAQPVNPR